MCRSGHTLGWDNREHDRGCLVWKNILLFGNQPHPVWDPLLSPPPNLFPPILSSPCLLFPSSHCSLLMACSIDWVLTDENQRVKDLSVIKVVSFSFWHLTLSLSLANCKHNHPSQQIQFLYASITNWPKKIQIQSVYEDPFYKLIYIS